MPRPGAKRARNEAERQAKLQRILDAALDAFVEKGFAATRLDDVAARAGVAKGTLYLYVDSKQGLFEALIRSRIAAPMEAMSARVLAEDATAEATLRALFDWVGTELLATRRREVVHLIVSEAGRFPDIAEVYFREVVGRGMAILREVARRAVARGEFRSDALARFPQLAIAPMLVALVWANLFQRFEPLDAHGLLDTHLDLLMRALKESRPCDAS